ncbi:hypothetical protein EC973_004145 [Apophysomyces ossiformis]|uniref:Peptidase metallopeptidase domain-containing protein n=1 Tax=Apophysomyces ossiformis TaxID=679940 RepID=A0A8H7BEX6_9FUNG|nr:hypothetical protein EC973_004145 [Apophysomyces ossiformis]
MTEHINDNLREPDPDIHVFRKGLCVSGARPRQRSPLELSLDAQDGFIPLWAKGVVLRYRFDQRTLRWSGRTREEILKLFDKAVEKWGDAVPVKFVENTRAWDFEIIVREHKVCYQNGCTLASAFFPGGGQQKLTIYPSLFDQIEFEQVETLVHELGHVFGLRHWFAKEMEQEWKAELFGTQNPFTIMNYGENSTLTEVDKDDLKRLYNQAWSGELSNINGTPIRLLQPFSANLHPVH